MFKNTKEVVGVKAGSSALRKGTSPPEGDVSPVRGRLPQKGASPPGLKISYSLFHKVVQLLLDGPLGLIQEDLRRSRRV